MSETLIEKIKEEYQKGRSAKEVGDILKLSERKVRYLMQKAHIKTRSRSEATYYKRNPHGDPFQIIDQIENPKDLLLFFVSLGLYLGEGTKRGNYQVALGNTNPLILRTFLNFLRRICKVNESKVFAELNIFDDIDKDEAIEYWAKNTGLIPNQIHHTVIRKRKDGNYKNKSKYGTLTIKVCNSKLKKLFLIGVIMYLKIA